MLVIVDYGMGNLHSVSKAFHRLGIKCRVSSSPSEIEDADKLILPGVGHFKNGMSRLLSSGIADVLRMKVVEEKTPILGICLGMQLFSKHSEEGDAEGLSWIDSKTVKFRFPEDPQALPVPHIGWNGICPKPGNPIFNGVGGAHFYFVHSYHVVCASTDDVAATTRYGFDFCSAVQRDNIYGTQFHPEKSHDPGLQILKNFAELGR